MDPDDVQLPKFNEFSTFYTFEDLKRRAKALDHWNDLVKRSKALDGDTTNDIAITKTEYKAAEAKATAVAKAANKAVWWGGAGQWPGQQQQPQRQEGQEETSISSSASSHITKKAKKTNE